VCGVTDEIVTSLGDETGSISSESDKSEKESSDSDVAQPLPTEQWHSRYAHTMCYQFRICPFDYNDEVSRCLCTALRANPGLRDEKPATNSLCSMTWT
jgi:hypothetical protein